MLRDLRTIYDVGTSIGLTDRQLLERFQFASRAADHDGAEAALTALIDRHAAMVWSVCRSIIRDRHDVEDAFQATFLILVRKAGSLGVNDTLGPWLHVVACRTALSVRKARARRREVERAAVKEFPKAVYATISELSWDDASEVRAAMHAEIAKLPAAFRAVLVLCDIEGLSYSQASLRLKIPLGTVQSRLARARLRLRKGLTQQGVRSVDAGQEPNGSLHAPILGLIIAKELPPALLERVGRVGVLIATNPVQWKATMASSVRALVTGGLRTMWLGALRRIVVFALAGIVAGGAVFYTDARSGPAVADATPQQERKVKPELEVKQPIEIPSPRHLRAASGRGKAALYLLNRDGERIALRQDAKVVRYQEVERTLNRAAITGVIDHLRVQRAFFRGNVQPVPPAERLYRRVELQRQARRDDGSWTDSESVDSQANLKILDNLPSREEERVPDQFLMYALIDPLPHLVEGEWSGVDVEGFVPAGTKARRRVPVPMNTPLKPQQHRPAELMVRSLDFTVEPGRTYRYRARAVFFNPNLNQGNPRDRRKEIIGPWSESTETVTIPGT